MIMVVVAVGWRKPVVVIIEWRPLMGGLIDAERALLCSLKTIPRFQEMRRKMQGK